MVCGPHCFFTPYCHPCQETLQFSYHERNFIHSWVQNPVMWLSWSTKWKKKINGCMPFLTLGLRKHWLSALTFVYFCHPHDKDIPRLVCPSRRRMRDKWDRNFPSQTLPTWCRIFSPAADNLSNSSLNYLTCSQHSLV